MAAPDPNPELVRLSTTQRTALLRVERRALLRSPAARREFTALLSRSGVVGVDHDRLANDVCSRAPVHLSFHPDRVSRSGETVARALLDEGVYRNQYETGLSSGSLSAFPGGARDSWEEQLFGGAYHVRGNEPGDRPKYGALDLMHHADGASPRFGSCYLVLRTEVAARCSFTYGGSQSPHVLEHSGTCAAMECVMLALFEAVERDGAGLGVADLTINDLLDRLTAGFEASGRDVTVRGVGRALDSFVEAQVHGPVDLRRDAVRLVADPAFRETSTGEVLESICERYDLELDRHPGFTLAADRVPGGFRGPKIPPLARRIAVDGMIDVAAIGIAASSLRRNPEDWSELGPPDEVLQLLKQMWHVLVRYGSPAPQP